MPVSRAKVAFMARLLSSGQAALTVCRPKPLRFVAYRRNVLCGFEGRRHGLVVLVRVTRTCVPAASLHIVVCLLPVMLTTLPSCVFAGVFVMTVSSSRDGKRTPGRTRHAA